MINFIQNNPLIVVLGLIVILAVLLLLIISVKNKKSKSKKKNTEPKKEVSKSEKKTNSEPKSVLKIRRYKLKYFNKRTDNKSKRKSQKKVVDKFLRHTGFVTYKKRKNLPGYKEKPASKKIKDREEFAKPTKKSVKFATRNQMLGVVEMPEPLPEPEPIPQPVQQPAQTSEVIKIKDNTPPRFIKDRRTDTRYFDKTRRISQYIKDGNIDDMFESHISDIYMNINLKRHLNVGRTFSKRLYDRASKVLAHGEIKLLADEELRHHENRVIWLKKRSKEERKKLMGEVVETFNDELDDEIEKDERVQSFVDDTYGDDLPGEYIEPSLNLNSKNILTVDSVLHRKNNFNRKNNNKK